MMRSWIFSIITQEICIFIIYIENSFSHLVFLWKLWYTTIQKFNFYKFLIKKIIVLFSKDALNWLKVTVKYFLLRYKRFIFKINAVLWNFLFNEYKKNYIEHQIIIL